VLCVDEKTGVQALDCTEQVPAGLDVHVICDNSSTHKTGAIRRWLVRHPLPPALHSDQ
jgi:hypothetical protein